MTNIHNSPWVTTLGAKKNAPWFSIGTETTSAAGSVIYTQDSPSLYLYYLIEGRIKVSIINEDGDEKTLAIHEAGSFFGETSFFDGQPSFATAVAMQQSRILLFGKKRISLLFHAYPDVGDMILASMGRKIRLLTMQIEELSFFDIEKRVAHLLLKLIADISETDENGGVRLTVAITDQELGNLVGVRREAVTKVISKFRKIGILTKEKKFYHFPDPQRLDEFVMSGLDK